MDDFTLAATFSPTFVLPKEVPVLLESEFWTVLLLDSEMECDLYKR